MTTDEPDSPLARLGHTEESFQAMMKRRALLGMRRKFTIILPLSVHIAFTDIVRAVKEGELSKEQADVEFDQRIRPHFGPMPAGFNKQRGDVVQFDYERPQRNIIRPS